MPLLFDMKLADLTSYQGTNPRPPDFEEYWDAALTELASVDPEVELVPADFQAPYAECFHLYFTERAAHACMPSCCALATLTSPSRSAHVPWL